MTRKPGILLRSLGRSTPSLGREVNRHGLATILPLLEKPETESKALDIKRSDKSIPDDNI